MGAGRNLVPSCLEVRVDVRAHTALQEKAALPARVLFGAAGAVCAPGLKVTARCKMSQLEQADFKLPLYSTFLNFFCKGTQA